MSLAEKIQEDVKSALKGGDKKKLSIARYLSSELKNYLIKENLDRELSRISDDNFYKIVKTQVKQKRESLEFAEKVGDSIKVDELNYDIDYLNNFLPKLMGEKETHKIIRDIIDKNTFLQFTNKIENLLENTVISDLNDYDSSNHKSLTIELLISNH